MYARSFTAPKLDSGGGGVALEVSAPSLLVAQLYGIMLSTRRRRVSGVAAPRRNLSTCRAYGSDRLWMTCFKTNTEGSVVG